MQSTFVFFFFFFLSINKNYLQKGMNTSRPSDSKEEQFRCEFVDIFRG